MRRRLTVLLATIGLALPSGKAVAVNGLPGRNHSLEAAVVNRLLEQGFGRTNRIAILPPKDGFRPELGDGGFDPFASQSPDSRYDYRWAQSSRDRGLQQQIATRLQTDIPGGRDLYVLVQNGQAFLFGRVRNQQQRQHAEAIARDAESIERVRNQVIVEEQGWAPREDSSIEEAIRTDLSGSLFVNADRIDVDVAQGIAVLAGTVDSFSELVVAVESAFRGGARTVHSQVQIARRPDRIGGTDAASTQPNSDLNRSR
jgi:osmotically-inducible protein OsmY